MIVPDDQVRAMARAMIAERYESQVQAARIWHMSVQILNDALQGRRPMPAVVLEKLGLERVKVYRKKGGSHDR